MKTAIAILVVIAGWAVLGAALVGLGRGARRILTRAPVDWRLGDFWTGLAVAVAFVFGAHLLLPVQPWLWVVLAPCAAAGLLVDRRPSPRAARPAVWWILLGAAVAVYVADRALQPLSAYDSGLYHVPTLEWMHAYPAVPGLANFHGRLGFNSGSSAYAALVGSTVPANVAHHFANSLLAMALCVEWIAAARLLTRRQLPAARYVAPLLLVLSTPALLYPLHRSQDISSPSPDLPALVVTLAAALYLGKIASQQGRDDGDWVTAVALLALLPVMRVQLGVVTAVALLLVVAGFATRRVPHPPPRGVLAALAGLVATVWTSWAAHGFVLSGYPAYPTPILGLPVSWRVPAADAAREAAWIRSWPRVPGVRPREVLADWDWLQPWAARTVDNTEILGMMLLSGAGTIVLAVLLVRRALRRDLVEGSARRAARAAEAAGLVGLAALIVLVQGADRFPAAMLALAVAVILFTVIGLAVAHVVRPDDDQPWSAPAALIGLATLAALVSWFILAPDPRFSIGALWLCAAVPAAAALSSVWPHHRTGAAVILVLLVALASAYPGRGLMKEQDLSPARADPSQRLGLSQPPTTETRTFERDGVTFRRPVLNDTCWAESLPCTPYKKHWRLRHAGSLQDGFVNTRPRNQRGASGD